MKGILLPTDFSDNSWRAMCYAAQLFHHSPVKYYLLNNYSNPYDPVEAGIAAYFEPLKKKSRDGLAVFEKRFRDLEHHPATEFKSISTYGPVHATIQFYENNEPETHLVVIGTRGASGLSEIFLGTTTAGVIDHVKSPVVVVPLEAELHTPMNILLAIDPQGVDNPGEVRPLIDIAKSHKSNIAVVNVHLAETPVVLEENSPEEFVIDHYFEDVRHSYHSIDGKYVEDKLMQFANREHSDLIATIHRDRGFWRNLFHSSLSRKLAYHSDIPILILKNN